MIATSRGSVSRTYRKAEFSCQLGGTRSKAEVKVLAFVSEEVTTLSLSKFRYTVDGTNLGGVLIGGV